MATIYKRLSKRVQADTDLTEVLLRLRNGKDYDLNAKSGIFVTPDNFRNGEIIVNRRKVGNDVQYHEKQRKKMDSLCAFVLQQVTDTQKEYINAAQGGLSVAGGCRCLTKDGNTSIEKEGYIPYPLQA